MKFAEEFRNPEAARKLLAAIERVVAYEIGLRRPLGRLWASAPRERYLCRELRWAYAADVWRS